MLRLAAISPRATLADVRPTSVSATPHPAEGRRGRSRRDFLERYAPDELPTPRQPATDPREQARQTRLHDRDQIERLVLTAARKAGVYPSNAAQVLGAYFEAVATELVSGNAVIIPGFAALVARPTRPHPTRRQRIYVSFAAHRNLSIRVCEWAQQDDASIRRWESYRHDARPSGRSRRAVAEAPEQRIRRAWQRLGSPAAARRAAS